MKGLSFEFECPIICFEWTNSGKSDQMRKHDVLWSLGIGNDAKGVISCRNTSSNGLAKWATNFDCYGEVLVRQLKYITIQFESYITNQGHFSLL